MCNVYCSAAVKQRPTSANIRFRSVRAIAAKIHIKSQECLVRWVQKLISPGVTYKSCVWGLNVQGTVWLAAFLDYKETFYNCVCAKTKNQYYLFIYNLLMYTCAGDLRCIAAFRNSTKKFNLLRLFIALTV